MFRHKLFTAFALVMVIVVALMIFGLSAQQGEDSSEFSKRISDAILSVFRLDRTGMTAAEWAAFREAFNLALRKLAHFTEYAMLGLAMTAFLGSTRRFGLGVKLAIMSLVLCALYAVGDEIHQRFVADRGPAVLDVLIDSAGALVGDLLGVVIYRWHERSKASRMAAARSPQSR